MESQGNINQQQSTPNSTASLVLGIISIPTCFCFGIVGLVSGIIALVLAKKGKDAYEESPEQYTKSSFGNLKAGKVCGIIGVSLSGIYVLYLTIYFLIFGTMISSLPWQDMMDANKEQMEQFEDMDEEELQEMIEGIDEEEILEQLEEVQEATESFE